MMKPIFESQRIVDEEEIKTYKRYTQIPTQISKYSTLDYHSYIEKNPDQILKQSKWTSYTEPLLLDTDFHQFRSRTDAQKDFRADLEPFDTFGNFHHTKLDSYKLENIVLDLKESQAASAETDFVIVGGKKDDLFNSLNQ